MTLHFIGLPHTETTRKYEWCAYSTKLRHMGEICQKIGIDTVLYGSNNDQGGFGEVVEVVSEDDRQNWFGHINWNSEAFGGWSPDEIWWQVMNHRAIKEISQRIEPTDIICIIAGRCQPQFQKAFPNHLVVEWAVGYEGILDNTHCCFESNAWRHYVYASKGIKDGRFFDCVIPNSFDPNDYIYKKDKEDYLLYLGRLIDRKGLNIVGEIAKHHKIITAGQGTLQIPNTEHIGVVTGKEKAELLANAKGLLTPTLYIEPFGGVAVEAMMSGTPVISTDFGAFTETVIDNVSGFRCRTLSDFLEAADRVNSLRPYEVFSWSLNYSLNAVSPRWERWFTQLGSLYERGWYQ